MTQPCRCSLPACLCMPRASRSAVSIPVCAAAEEGSERRVSKAGYDITPLTLAKQQELAAGLSAHQRCTPLCLPACLPADLLLQSDVLFHHLGYTTQPQPCKSTVVSLRLGCHLLMQELAYLMFAWNEQGCGAGVGHGARFHWQDRQRLLARPQGQGAVGRLHWRVRSVTRRCVLLLQFTAVSCCSTAAPTQASCRLAAGHGVVLYLTSA